MKGFKITLTAIYNNDDITDDQICEHVWNALKSTNDKMALCNISSIKSIKKNLDDEIKKIKEQIERQ